MSLDYEYDESRDVMIIAGQEYTGVLLRAWGSDGIKTGTLFRLVRNSYGCMDIELADNEPGVYKPDNGR